MMFEYQDINMKSQIWSHVKKLRYTIKPFPTVFILLSYFIMAFYPDRHAIFYALKKKIKSLYLWHSHLICLHKTQILKVILFTKKTKNKKDLTDWNAIKR